MPLFRSAESKALRTARKATGLFDSIHARLSAAIAHFDKAIESHNLSAEVHHLIARNHEVAAEDLAAAQEQAKTVQANVAALVGK